MSRVEASSSPNLSFEDIVELDKSVFWESNVDILDVCKGREESRVKDVVAGCPQMCVLLRDECNVWISRSCGIWDLCDPSSSPRHE